VVDEIYEGRSYRTSSIKIDQIGAMHLTSQESADQVDERMDKDRNVRNRHRVRFWWCCSLERGNVRCEVDKDVGGSHTERPSVLFGRYVL
jgi:hypothetical protein